MPPAGTFSAEPSSTQPIVSSLRSTARPRIPLSKTRSSSRRVSGRPVTVATPSPACTTRPKRSSRGVSAVAAMRARLCYKPALQFVNECCHLCQSQCGVPSARFATRSTGLRSGSAARPRRSASGSVSKLTSTLSPNDCASRARQASAVPSGTGDAVTTRKPAPFASCRLRPSSSAVGKVERCSVHSLEPGLSADSRRRLGKQLPGNIEAEVEGCAFRLCKHLLAFRSQRLA